MMQRSLLSLQAQLHDAVAKQRLKIILASASPRRFEALSVMLGSAKVFEVKTSDFSEDLPHADYSGAEHYCMATAKMKMQEVVVKLRPTCKTIVIAADTVVAFKDHILEKPTDELQAVKMLQMLSGNVHEVHTSVAINALPDNQEICAFTVTSHVLFAKLTADEIKAYIATGEYKDKAGGYGIQGQGRMLVESITGDFFNVAGLPAREFAINFAKVLQPILDQI